MSTMPSAELPEGTLALHIIGSDDGEDPAGCSLASSGTLVTTRAAPVGGVHVRAGKTFWGASGTIEASKVSVTSDSKDAVHHNGSFDGKHRIEWGDGTTWSKDPETHG